MIGKKTIRLVFFAIVIIVFAILLSIIWTPNTNQISSNFYYQANIDSVDNFYDNITGNFMGEQKSRTNFSYDAISLEGDVLTIKNVFDVRTFEGEEIFSVEREYGVDRKTGAHVLGYGDKDRIGYLFAPKDLKKGQPFTYWHINYDEPALMEFKEEEIINYLKVYRYEADYHADQTANLMHLPGVPEERGINLDINLKIWVEPVTGVIVKYTDNTTAYYYDLETGNRIHPWNRFQNTYQESSIRERVREAVKERNRVIFFRYGFSAILISVAIFLLILAFLRKASKEKY